MCSSNSKNYSASSPAVNYNQPADTWYCNECGELNMNWYDVCPVCDRGVRQNAAFQSYAASHTACGSAGSPAPGSWVCSNCGAANSANTPDFCPICGYR
ncbi:hypothetical protein ST47_g2048 [Ascochyta rabiei]|uniref:Uncharacterized protein n=1 Tax=Didymella rabiei TaxID=5454 RepID=A0A163K6R1_DIDRA|nr:hypothetical protein ST47_g2048 [Ascochyta rabiei]